MDNAYKNNDCVGCRFYKQYGCVWACNYLDMMGHSRASLYGHDIDAMPEKCEQFEVKRRRGRPPKNSK